MHRPTAFGLAIGALLVALGVVLSVSDEWILVKLTLPLFVPGMALVGYAFTRPREEPGAERAPTPAGARFAAGCFAGGALIVLIAGCGAAAMFSSWP